MYHRALQNSSTNHSEEWKAFRKFCCIPSFVFFIFWTLGLSLVILLVVALHGPNPLLVTDKARVDTIVAICILSTLLGCLLMVLIVTSWKVFSSVFFQTSKIRFKLSNKVGQNRAEIAQLSQALSIIDCIKKTKTRICLLINGLDVSEQSQLALLLHGIHNVYSAFPIVTVLCIDYQAATTALQKTSLR